MSDDPRQSATHPTRTATTADGQSLDTFNTERNDSTTVSASDGRTDAGDEGSTRSRSTESTASRDGNGSDRSDTGGEGDEGASAIGSGISADGSPDPGSSANLIQGESSGEVTDSGAPRITVGEGSDSRSDGNMLTHADPSAEGGDSNGASDQSGGDRRSPSPPAVSSRPDSLDTFTPVETGVLPSEVADNPNSITTGTTFGADTSSAGAIPIATVDGPPPAEPESVDGPSLIPGRSTVLGDRGVGESAPGSMMPDVTPGSALDDQLGIDTSVSGSGKTWFGEGRLGLPSAPVAEDLGGGHDLDVGVDFNNLTGAGTIDGRGVDPFDGVGTNTGASGPADRGGMTSEGGSVLSSLTSGPTEGTFGEWVGSLLGFKTSEEKSFEKADGVANAMNSENEKTATEPDGTSPAPTPSQPKINLGSNKEQFNHIGDDVPKGGHTDGGDYKGYWGARPSLMKGPSVPGSGQDSLPPDHPDYVAPPGSVPLGSAPTDAIQQSVVQGLGGQRGGDVDPYDDPAGTAAGGAVQVDAYDSVVDPGPDGFLASPVTVDSSLLGGPLDAVEPYLADE